MFEATPQLCDNNTIILVELMVLWKLFSAFSPDKRSKGQASHRIGEETECTILPAGYGVGQRKEAESQE